MHILCPHCRNPIEVVKISAREEIACPSCGSSFRVETDSKTGSQHSAGRKLGKFELLDTVGHGAFGTVYKARDPELDRIVAIKVPRAGNLIGPQDLNRFLREARSVAQLRHPSIVSIHEVNEADGVPYLVSDFVQGVTLTDLLSARRPGFRESAELVAAVADALQFAHERGVVHRDVKPSNIMLGDDGTPHVMDFGLAKREAGEITMTIEGQVLGTPAYMPPEQARGEGHAVDARGDVYSLGVILYQLLTGELPFRGTTRMLLHQVMNDDPRSLRSLNDRIPRDLETICLKAMAKEPSRRYPMARDLAGDLRHFLKGEPILARPVGQGERLWRWCRRNPGLAGALSATALAVLAVALVSVLFAVSEKQNAQKLSEALKTSEENRRRSEYRLADNYLYRGYALCQQEDVGRGLLWLARALKTVPEDTAELHHAIRANLAAWYPHLHAFKGHLRHPGHVNAFAVSPDGKTIATAGEDGTVRRWDAATGQPAGPLLQHDKPVVALAFSPRGTSLLTTCRDDERREQADMKLWETDTGKCLWTAPAGDMGVVFSRDGRSAAAVVGYSVQVWDVATGKPAGPPTEAGWAILAVALSPDGQTVATATGMGAAHLWDAKTGKRLGQPLQHQLPFAVFAVAFSPDGRTVVTGSMDKTARLWDAATGKPTGVTLRHEGTIWAVAFSPDGQTILTASDDQTAQLWDAASGQRKAEPMRHRDAVKSAVFSSDGRLILTGSNDRTARLWEAATARPLGQPLEHNVPVTAVAFGAGDRTVITLDGSVRLWLVGRGTGSTVFEHPHAVAALAISPDGKVIATGVNDQTPRFRDNDFGAPDTGRLWDPSTGRLIGKPLEHHNRGPWNADVHVVAFSPDSRVVLTGSSDQTARLWDARTAQPVGAPLAHKGRVTAAAFSPDGRFLVTGSNYPDGWNADVHVKEKAWLWETATGKLLSQPMGHQSAILSVAFSPDGRAFATGNSDGTARLCEVPSCKPVGEPLRHQGSVLSVDFSPDGRTVLTGSADGTARVWDAASGRPLGQPLQHLGRVDTATFSPDGKTVLTGSENGTARLWEATTGKPVGQALLHHHRVTAAVFSPDGRSVLTASEDKSARVWDALTGKPIGPILRHRGTVVAAAYSPDGRQVLTGSWDKTARLWSIPPALNGEPERIDLWSRVVTGMELDDTGVTRVLDEETLRGYLSRLEQLGGPPVP